MEKQCVCACVSVCESVPVCVVMCVCACVFVFCACVRVCRNSTLAVHRRAYPPHPYEGEQDVDGYYASRRPPPRGYYGKTLCQCALSPEWCRLVADICTTA